MKLLFHFRNTNMADQAIQPEMSLKSALHLWKRANMVSTGCK